MTYDDRRVTFTADESPAFTGSETIPLDSLLDRSRPYRSRNVRTYRISCDVWCNCERARLSSG